MLLDLSVEKCEWNTHDTYLNRIVICLDNEMLTRCSWRNVAVIINA